MDSKTGINSLWCGGKDERRRTERAAGLGENSGAVPGHQQGPRASIPAASHIRILRDFKENIRAPQKLIFTLPGGNGQK